MLKRWGLILLILSIGIWGCSDDDPVVPETSTDFEDLAAEGAAYINGTAPGVLDAADVVLELAAYTILDFRSTGVYDDGHIPGAIDASLATLKANADTYDEGKPFLCVCYTGHSAGHAVFVLQMLGYEAYSLGWGMSSWHTSTMSPWSGLPGDVATPVQTDAPELTVTYDFPVLADYSIDARLDAVLDGSNFITYATMQTKGLDDYFIVNYFTPDQYMGVAGSNSPGHIDGSFQFTPKESLGVEDMLEYLPTDGTPIVVYCWTGQHGSQVAAYLNMLGYDAYDLKGGSNVLWHDQLGDHKWADHANTYPLETTPDPFADLAAAGAAYINGTAPGVLEAANVALDLEGYTILDFRSTPVYTTSHIPGAIDADISTLIANAATYDEGNPFLCVCYTGHTAGHAVFVLQMLGYEAYSLGWGMSSWSTTTMAPWSGLPGDVATPVQTDAPELTVTYDFPVLADYSVAARLEAVVDGSNFITYSAMQTEGLSSYFIINYFTPDQYMGVTGSGSPGHLDGSYQFTPKESLGMDEMLEYLPTDGTPIVVYCWTGQHGSQVAAYLNMLGYDAYDLKGSSNVLWHDLLGGHKWADHTNDYPLEP